MEPPLYRFEARLVTIATCGIAIKAATVAPLVIAVVGPAHLLLPHPQNGGTVTAL